MEKFLHHQKGKILKQILIVTLKNFRIVKTLLGVYQQQTGPNSGSALSPMLSNIFIHKLELKMVEKFKKSGNQINFLDTTVFINSERA